MGDVYYVNQHARVKQDFLKKDYFLDNTIFIRLKQNHQRHKEKHIYILSSSFILNLVQDQYFNKRKKFL